MFKKNLKILAITFMALFGVALIGGAFFFFSLSAFAVKPFNPQGADTVFNILPGQSLKTISRNLAGESIVSNPLYFMLFTKFKKAGTKLQAGEYALSAAASPEQILEILVKGKVMLHRITIPEGLNIKEIAAVVEGAGFCSSARFMGLCRDSSFLNTLNIMAPTLEGYLFPDTYFFTRQTSCEKIIITMVERFKAVFTRAWELRSMALGFSVHEIVTLASIIEKETGDASERPLIASVFHNRLKKNMRLESDPTVIYDIKDFDGNIKRSHLEMKTPYNTYQIKGLPPGPIASPGALSLQAALYPAQTDYLFFVSKQDTTHQFSKTIQEHNQAVKTFQLNKK